VIYTTTTIDDDDDDDYADATFFHVGHSWKIPFYFVGRVREA
jgi:hypothetical protein